MCFSFMYLHKSTSEKLWQLHLFQWNSTERHHLYIHVLMHWWNNVTVAQNYEFMSGNEFLLWLSASTTSVSVSTLTCGFLCSAHSFPHLWKSFYSLIWKVYSSIICTVYTRSSLPLIWLDSAVRKHDHTVSQGGFWGQTFVFVKPFTLQEYDTNMRWKYEVKIQCSPPWIETGLDLYVHVQFLLCWKGNHLSVVFSHADLSPLASLGFRGLSNKLVKQCVRRDRVFLEGRAQRLTHWEQSCNATPALLRFFGSYSTHFRYLPEKQQERKKPKDECITHRAGSI